MSQVPKQANSAGLSGELINELEWASIEAQLSRIPREYFDPRFDSLKNVLEILQAVDSEVQVEQLRGWKQTVERLVDEVVEAYYSGFNRSLQNYTQILKLFSESKVQLEILRRSLDSAHRSLTTQSQQLRELYRNGLMLADVRRLLADVSSLVEVPKRVEELKTAGNFPLAVSSLLEACNKLARKELADVKSLDTLRTDVVATRDTLVSALIPQLETYAYTTNITTTTTGSSYTTGIGSGIGGSGSVYKQQSLPSMMVGLTLSDSSSLSLVSGGGGGGGLNNTNVGGGGGRHRRTHSYAPRNILSDVDGHLLDPAQKLTSLVDCLGELGAVGTARMRLRRQLPVKLRSVVATAIESFPSLHPQQSTVATTTTAGGGGASALVDANTEKVLAATAVRLLRHIFQHLLHVFSSVCKVQSQLGSTKGVAVSAGLKLLLSEDDLTLSNNNTTNGGGGSSSQSSKEAAAQALITQECVFAWECIQLECETLLAALLNVPVLAWHLGDSSVKDSTGGLLSPRPVAGWLAHTDQSTSGGGISSSVTSRGEGPAAADGGSNRLQFSLEQEIASLHGGKRGGNNGMPGSTSGGIGGDTTKTEIIIGGSGRTGLTATVAAARASTSYEEGGGGGGFGGDSSSSSSSSSGSIDYVETLARVLGKKVKGPGLASVAFLPVVEFAEEGERVLANVPLSGGSSSKFASFSPGSTTTSARSPGNMSSSPYSSSSKKGQSGRLKAYIEHAVRMEFLPALYVSSRERCSALLSNPEAFRIRPHLHQPTSTATATTTLLASTSCVSMAEDLLEHASNVPPFAAHISGVLENQLGRIAGAFQEQVSTGIGRSAAGVLASHVPVVQAMAREPASSLLGSSMAFFTGKNADAMDTFVSSAVAAGFGAKDESQEQLVWAAVINERPVQSNRLLCSGNDVQRAVMLASLANSADHIANALSRCMNEALGQQRQQQLAAIAEQQHQQQQGGSTKEPTTPTGSTTSPIPNIQEGLQHLQRLGARLNPLKHLYQFGGAGGGHGGAPGRDRSFFDGLQHVVDRFKALSGQFMRILRLELLLIVVYSLELVPQVATHGPEATEAEERVLNTTRLLPRLKDGLSAYLTSDQIKYVFGTVADATPRFAIELLKEFAVPLDSTCITRVCRLLSTLQPVIAAVSPQTDAARRVEAAKHYYAMLMQPPETVVALALKKPRHFQASAYLQLLDAQVAGRVVKSEHKQKLKEALSAAAAAKK